MTASHPVRSNIRLAASGESTSPLPITGISISSLILPMYSHLAGLLNRSCFNRGCTEIASTPLSWSIIQNSFSVSQSRVQPKRIFAVSGKLVALRLVLTITSVRFRSFIREIPPPRLVMRAVVHPMFKSSPSPLHDSIFSMAVGSSSADETSNW